MRDAPWGLGVSLERYRGLWVAVSEGRVVAHDRDVTRLLARARKEFPAAVLAQVPEEEILIV